MTNPRDIDLQLLHWKDDSNTGMTIKFQLSDEDDLAYFQNYTLKKGKMAGQLFTATFKITDDQADEPEEPPKKTWNDLGPLCRSAIDLCKEQKFWKFMNDRWGGDPIEKEADAEEVFKHRLNIESRTELDAGDGAGNRFKAVIKDYRKWRVDNA